MDKYVPRVGHEVKHRFEGDRVFTITEVFDDIPYATVGRGIGMHIDNLFYVPRHAADAVNHSFRHANPDDLYFDPDDESADEFFAYYRPKHRA